MKYNLWQSLLWILAYIVLALMPPLVALVGATPSPRPFWIELGVLAGFLNFGILGLQFVTTGRFRWFAAGFSLDNLLQFHRMTGIFALILIVAHPVILMMADSRFLAFFDPSANFPRAAALSLVVLAGAVLVATTLWRLSFQLAYEHWRILHGLLAFTLLFLALGHVLMVDNYSEPFWKKGAFAVMAGFPLYLLVHSRFVRPWFMQKKPYRLVRIRAERNDSWTLVLEPEGHGGLQFRPGQFAWITLGDTPFSLQQHPFTIASSAMQRPLEFTIKELGDFTASIKRMRPWRRAWVEGPYGSFFHEVSQNKGAVFMAGGVGITPIMSMLRTCCDCYGNISCVLIYGNSDWDAVLFREEIEEIQSRLNLRVVHVLEDPPEGWKGEEGFIGEEVLKRHLPEDLNNYEYFICGPDPMMDACESVLRQRGIPPWKIFSERFDMV